MFSKHRKLWKISSCLLFALLITLGSFGYQQTDWNGTSATTFPATTEVAAEATHAGTDATDETVFSPIPVENSRPVSFFQQFCSAVAILFGVLFAGVYLYLSDQNRPFLGPETEILILIILIRVIQTGSAFLLFPALAAAITLLGCLVAWIRSRLNLSWLGIHRAAMATGGKGTPFRFYLPIVFGFCILFAFFGFLLFSSSYFYFSLIDSIGVYHPFSLSVALWSYFCALLCVLLVVRYQISTTDLFRQIHSMEKGSVLPPKDNLFTREQEILFSQQQEKEDAIRKAVADERFKVELISNVSHDLRTPLTSILGYGELLENESLSAEGKTHLAKLNRKSRYMRDLVDSLFDLTKVSSGALEPNLQEIDLIRLLEQTIGLEDDALTARNLVVKRKYCCDSLSLCTDGNRVHQVFMNLLENAMKYALQGTRIYLTVKESERCATVTLTNTASYEMDFSPEEILQRFARGDKARTTQGSGLGLAIAQTYTESVGGSFQIEIDGDQFRAIVSLPKAERKP